MVYRGVPFAAPPVGELRWRPPEPALAWEGVRDATEAAPACMQNPLPAAAQTFYDAGVDRMDEDCLYLNVWTAAGPDDRAPVLVWIHGGGLSIGNGADITYDGTRLAQRGVVLVTINYRLGAFGYLAHPLLSAESGHGASGNYGLLDQIAALGWVHRNIAAFGGDPSRVTIFGESAGSWSVNQRNPETIRSEYGEHADALLETFPAETDEEAQRARIASGTDATFGREMRTWARMMETVSSPAYLYFFSRVPPAPDADRYGAYHTAEIPYVFDNFGVSPHPYANRDYTDTDRRLSDILASYWVNMAATGDPNGEGLPEWPAYDPEADAALHVGDTITVERGIRRDRLDFFDLYYAAQREGSD